MVLKTSYNRKIATKEPFLQNNHVYDSPLLRCISNLREKKKLAPPIPQTKTISHIFDWLQFTKLVIRVSCETC